MYLDTSAMIFNYPLPYIIKLQYKPNHTNSGFMCLWHVWFLSNFSVLQDAKKEANFESCYTWLSWKERTDLGVANNPKLYFDFSID